MLRRLFPLLIAVVIGSVAAAGEDLAIEGIRAKLEALDAYTRDLEAGMRQRALAGETADGITSLRKNATVTVGGLLTTGYYFQNYKMDSFHEYDPVIEAFQYTGIYRRRADARGGDLEISDAELYVDIQVNDHIDAFLAIDLHNSRGTDYDNAKAYWIRWKNICDTGFGLKVGRDSLVFGNKGYGHLDSWASGAGDGIAWVGGAFADYANVFGDGSGGFGPVPLHNGWKIDGVTQVTPYWENANGSLLVELSFMQSVDNMGNRMNRSVKDSTFWRSYDGPTRYRNRNDGLGTMSGRVTWTPVEGLKLTASVVNFYTKAFPSPDYISGSSAFRTRNNTAASLAVDYRPCFLNRINLWGQWIHGWSVGNFRGLDSDVVNAGASWDFTDNLTVFAQGDYLRSTYKYSLADTKGTGWAAYGGARYSFGHGATLEAGWRHERIKYHENIRGNVIRTTRLKGDTIYATLGFEF